MNNQIVSFKTPFWQKIILIILGLFLTIVILEMGLRLGGGILLSLQEYRNSLSIRQKGAYRILCLGESTTQGQYPRFLEEILNQRSNGIKFSVIDKGLSGINTSGILAALENNLNEYKPDMVVVMMGINDAGAHLPYQSPTTSRLVLFFRSFKTYKLIRLLWLHIVTKAKEVGFYKSNKNSLELQLDSQIGSLKRQEDHILNKGGIQKNIELNIAEESAAYVALGESYLFQGKYYPAEEAFLKATKLNPRNEQVFIKLGQVYTNQDRLLEAEAAFKKVIELNPNYDWAYVELGQVYLKQDKLLQAEASYKRAITLKPNNDMAYAGLSIVYREMSNFKLAQRYYDKTNALRLGYYNPITVNNYIKLADIISNRRVKLVCVQYPMRNIEPLKGIFQGRQEGIIFVDNERIFRDALSKASRSEYFRDMFGGDFGHCTEKGNRLLAENIIKTILK